ncbi:FtsK/SpoIIIE domain-containing protein [Mesorhizobium sp.]|uniref:FtsK/SpoIIIE domain-containing protein n=1 Tax=Mesorhizobium sp. TaxID=1871066 RepID=UPI00121BD705|nr:FtsK/SpoIIIE domain-containing protein [Mesorhizobium sp.]TIL65606.1 MAG: DNA translocase FtsK [Mesorhizobium sp.]
MTAELSLIGRMAARLVRRTLDRETQEAGFARFLLHGLSADEVAGIVSVISQDEALASRLDIKLPRHAYDGVSGIPQELLTDEAATNLRHALCDREGRILALTDDSQLQSLAQVEKIDADALLDPERVGDWVDEACGDLGLPEESAVHLHAALQALFRIDRLGLPQVAGYVSAVRADLETGTLPQRALGRALILVGLPRYDALFDDIPPSKLGWSSQWRQRYERHWGRQSYLAKRDAAQLPFSRTRLRDKLAELREDLRDEVVAALEAYVEAPDGASDDSAKLFHYDWSELERFFEEAQKSEGRFLGEETFTFYSIRTELVSETEFDYLTAFKDQRRQKSPPKLPEDDEFYTAHAHELRDDPRLAALWERFIFGQRVDCRDFLDGLAQALQRTHHQLAGAGRVLIVEGQEDTKSRFMSLNDLAVRQFAARNRGLGQALVGFVEFRRTAAFDYPAFASDIANHKQRTADATSRRARQLNFKIWLERRDGGAIEKSAELKLVWECGLGDVGLSLAQDLERLRTNVTGTPLVQCVAGRPKGSGRTRQRSVDLSDLKTLEPAASRERGAFVPARSKCQSLTKAWKAALEDLRADALVPDGVAEDLRDRYDAFEKAYRTALDDVATTGWGAASAQIQAEFYGQLLTGIVDQVSTPVALDRLLRQPLDVGVAHPGENADIAGFAIVCPWQPLRLAAQGARWRMLRRQMARLLADEPVEFTDAGGLFFNELRRALAEPLRPEIVGGWRGEKSTVLSLNDSVNDYTLHEPPVAQAGRGGTTSENVAPIAKQIAELVQRYLALQPHERDNLSVVLYNCDAAALPQAVVDIIRNEAQGEDGEAMCQVVLRHRDEGRLRGLYQQLVGREQTGDGLHASEATRDFMARLRITIMVNQAAPDLSADGPPYDIVFCHDVISRAARQGWVELQRMSYPADQIDAGHWSRRRPIRRGDRDAMVYLACPAQPSEGWAFLDALGALHDAHQAGKARAAGATLMPARQTDIQDPGTRAILNETHRLGAWVVNFDDLLDRRQLMDSKIRIIRYKHAAAGGRNLVISSKAPDELLQATLRGRLRALDPAFTPEELKALAPRLIDHANAISGDIVLRAAKRGSNANELIGVVMSRYLVEAELGRDRPKAWIFLDDYAAWLGQDEKRIADLLCLAPGVGPDGRPVLDIVVTEAKYVSAASATAKAGDSARQLRDTLKRLERALDPAQPPADREIWLARLSDMLLDGLRDPAGLTDQSTDWRRVLRDGECQIRLRGYSHVFAHAGPDAVALASDKLVGVAETDTGEQEQYGPDSLRRLLRCYAKDEDPTALRQEVRGESPPGSRGFESQPSATPMVPEPAPIPATVVEGPSANVVEAPGDVIPEGPPATHFQAALALTAPGAHGDTKDAAWLDDIGTRCRNALMRYGMSARLEQAVLTPNAALLKFRGSDELTVAAVERKLKELETTHSLEVVNVRAEPGRVAISIRRPKRETLTLGEVWRDWKVDRIQPNARLLIAVKEDDGGPLFLEPEPAPHTLVAGSTGSGKSVLIQNILLGIAGTNRPDQARIHLIDPKAGVDYFAFEPLPHLVDGIVDVPEDALVRLDGLVLEMEQRYVLFKAARAANLRAYNAKAAKPLPLIWLVHDEFADWMQIDSYRAGVESAVSRLGVKARAAGIYLVFAAQRPDATVFPMQLRSNLGNRLVLRVDSAGTSDLSLGQKGGGAERLLGKGHLAAILGGGTEPVFAQVPFVSDDDLVRLVEAIRRDLDEGS